MPASLLQSRSIALLLLTTLWAVALTAVGKPAAAADPAITEFSAGLTPGNQPQQITGGPDGNVWFTSWHAHGPGNDPYRSVIGRITPAGDITEFPVPTDSVGPIASGPDGNLWFSGLLNYGYIGRITPSGTVLASRAISSLPASVGGLVAGPDGNVWFTVTEYGPAPDYDRLGSIGRMTPTGAVTRFRNGLSPNEIPQNITMGPDGNLWFTARPDPNTFNPAGGKVGRITTDGAITEFSLNRFQHILPQSIAAGADGNLWFTVSGSSGEQPIGRITTEGATTYFAANSANPTNLTSGRDGNLWFTNNQGPTKDIGRVTPDGAVTTFSTGITQDPSTELRSITSGPDGNLWFAEGYGAYPFSGRIGVVWLSGVRPAPTQDPSPPLLPLPSENPVLTGAGPKPSAYDPCRGVAGDLGAKLFASLQCSADRETGAVWCRCGSVDRDSTQDVVVR